jgi:hypothetical protein
MEKDMIVVTYLSELIDQERDKKIIFQVEAMGYEWLDSGFDLTKNRRDLRFTLRENQTETALTFSHAIEAMKQGKKVARSGWNGKNMFIFLREGRKIEGVPVDSPMGGDFESRSHICMKDAQGMCVVGWLASQTDMLADDWQIAE